MPRVLVTIGTRKGAFLAWSDLARRSWELRGPFLAGAEVNDVRYVALEGPTILAAVKSAWWGPDVRLSHDFGETWIEPEPGLRFEPERERSVERVWVLEADTRSGDRTLYAGVAPAALFRSRDGGHDWEELAALADHPTRERWQPGAGGLMVHGICFDPRRPRRLFAAISAAGVFRSDDGGASWEPRNRGVRADFLPDKLPEVGQCTHRLEAHPQSPEVLYQQNHCGVYRTDDAGGSWTDISAGLPSRFGFALAVHPHDGDTIYVCPAEADDRRVAPGGAFRVYRSRDRGAHWEAPTAGLPERDAYVLVLRRAMATDEADPVGVYVGTQGGQLLASRDEGDSWEVLFPWLPPIYSVRAALVDDA